MGATSYETSGSFGDPNEALALAWLETRIIMLERSLNEIPTSDQDADTVEELRGLIAMRNAITDPNEIQHTDSPADYDDLVVTYAGLERKLRDAAADDIAVLGEAVTLQPEN